MKGRGNGSSGSLGAVVRRHRWAVTIALLLLLGAVPSVTWSLRPVGDSPDRVQRDPGYATQSGDVQAARRENLRTKGDETMQTSQEICAAFGTAYFARRYRVDRDPRTAARHFARRYEPAYRAQGYSGCLEGLLSGG
jgi:hypothetical protein